MRRRQAGNFHVAINIPEELLVLLLLHYIYIEHVKARNLHILLFQGILVSLIQCRKLEIFSIIETNCSISYFIVRAFHFTIILNNLIDSTVSWSLNMVVIFGNKNFFLSMTQTEINMNHRYNNQK